MKDILKISGLFPAVWAWLKEPLPALFDVTPRLSGEATLVAEIFIVAAFSAAIIPVLRAKESAALAGRLWWAAVVSYILAAVDIFAYARFVQLHPGSGQLEDLIQIFLWASFFALFTVGFTLCVGLATDMVGSKAATASEERHSALSAR